MAHPMLEKFQITVGQPFVITVDPLDVTESGEVVGYDVEFLPETAPYGLTMYCSRIYLDGESFEPEKKTFVEADVIKVWECYGFQGEVRSVIELSSEGGQGDFETDSFNSFEEDIEELYDIIERSYER